MTISTGENPDDGDARLPGQQPAEAISSAFIERYMEIKREMEAQLRHDSAAEVLS